jgi:fatty acid desaturase
MCGSDRVEWPTLAVAAAIYGGFGLLSWFHHDLPGWLLLPLAAYAVAWHGSLQHEVIHGHPTPWPLINRALVFPNLWLWMPFERYRDLHQRHHHDEQLTDPLCDPESYYLSHSAWQNLPAWRRALRWAYNTLAGRLLLGPLFAVGHLLREEGRTLRVGHFGHLPVWGLHLLGVALVLGWVVGVCGIPLADYLLWFVYPGISLSLLRSYLEHRAAPDWRQRTVAIEADPLLSLLFLNNNLHVLHHAEPGLPWYRLPARWRERRAELLAANGDYHYRGYGEIVARYLLWPKELPYHPDAGVDPAGPERAVLERV